jgi:nicotinate-nucleotide pyrophosphorylase (carboxylating)
MNIDLTQVSSDVKQALLEDVGSGDVTAALLPPFAVVEAKIIARESLLVCGRPWVNETFRQMDPTIELEWHVEEGSWQDEPITLCTIHGTARSILTAERTALNFLQTLSATATQAYYYVQQLRGYPTRLLDTRKTIPGLRAAQKYAVQCGGALNHRMGLYDAFLIKENHIKICGSVQNAISLARQTNKDLLVEVEVETLAELREALDAHPDRILLDNFSREMLRQAVKMNQPKYCELEASGTIDANNIVDVAKTGVDFISIGAMTKSIKAIDLSLLVNDAL